MDTVPRSRSDDASSVDVVQIVKPIGGIDPNEMNTVLNVVAASQAGSVRHNDGTGRSGGEEFSIFLSYTDLVGIDQLAETACQSIALLMPDIGRRRLRVIASIGVAGSGK